MNPTFGQVFLLQKRWTSGSTMPWRSTSSDEAFIHGNKSNTGEGDNPESGVRASPYVDRAIDEELKAYVLEGVDKISEVKQMLRP